MRGCYPGSFDPLTVAHLAIADAAREHCRLLQLDLVVSHTALGKDGATQPTALLRAQMISAHTARRPWLRAITTPAQLLVDVAAGYDWLVLGEDKWDQVTDPVWYGSEEARDDALAALPRVAFAPRPVGDRAARVALPSNAIVLPLPDELAAVSSSAVRAGRTDWRALP